jgi:hypothetical protein
MSDEHWKDVAKQIDECRYLYMRGLHEPRDNKIRFLVEEAGLQEPRPVQEDAVPGSVAALFKDAQPIESDSSSRLFEIVYDEYISYMVSNESYSKYPEPPEVFTGNLFRIYSWSYLLEMTRKTTYAGDDHPGPGPLEHHQIPCPNHVIDVITTRPPTIAIADRMASEEDSSNIVN